MGHIRDLTLNAFAYLRLPLAIAAFAFGMTAVGIVGSRGNGKKVVLVIAVGMILFVHAARIALVRFDSYLGSYPLAQRLEQSPPGQLIEANSYYAFLVRLLSIPVARHCCLTAATTTSSTALTHRMLPAYSLTTASSYQYGQGLAAVTFLPTARKCRIWSKLVGQSHLRVVTENAGNYLLTNYALP